MSNKRLRHFLGFVLCLVLLHVLSAAGSAASTKKSDSQPDPYQIGVIVGLTGGGGAIGQAMWKGAQLAIEEINSEGGIKGTQLEGIAEDSVWAPDPAVEALKRLISVKHVQAFVIGGSTALQASAPIITRNKVVALNPGAQSPALAGVSPNVFHVIPLGDYDIRVISRYAYEKLGLRRFAIMYVDNDTGRFNRGVFKKEFTALGGEVVAAEGFQQDATDFGVQLAKVRYAKPDGIYLAATPTECPFVVKQAREMGIDAQFISWATVETPQMIKIAGKAAEGLVYSATFLDLASKNESIAGFVGAYRRKWKEDPTIYAAFTYDSVRILAKAMLQTGYDGERIAKAIRDIRSFEAVSGKTVFKEDGTCIKPISVKMIQNGKFEVIGTFEAEN